MHAPQARQLLSEDRPALQKALQDVLYTKGEGSQGGDELRTTRLSVLLNSAMGTLKWVQIDGLI